MLLQSESNKSQGFANLQQCCIQRTPWPLIGNCLAIPLHHDKMLAAWKFYQNCPLSKTMLTYVFYTQLPK